MSTVVGIFEDHYLKPLPVVKPGFSLETDTKVCYKV